MILLGLPCDFCGSGTIAHCGDGECSWSRCPRCMSYGVPQKNMVQWRREDYVNPYTLLDVKTSSPKRKFPSWLDESYGRKHDSE